jgi:hypothetical protein
MKKITSLLVGIFAYILWSQFVYYSTDTVLVGWDAAARATSYNVKVAWVGDVVKREYNLGQVTATSITINRPRTGMFEVWVNAANASGASDWSKSIDSSVARVNNNARGWRIYFDTPAPSGGGIE